MSDYPTDAELESIQTWPHTLGFEGLMANVNDLWAYDGFGIHQDEDATLYRLATLGWSGNENLIGAMMDNPMFWAMCWQASFRGGLHFFRVIKPTPPPGPQVEQP